jgi:hypothetical protein
MTDDSTQATLRTLDEALVAAARAREANPNDARSVLAGVVEIFANLAGTNPRWGSHTAPLRELAMGLLDLDRGFVAPVLQPAIARPGAPIFMAEQISRVHAAYLMQGLMKYAGKSKKTAAAMVAREINVSPETVIDWRKTANNPRSNMNDQYRGLCAKDRSAWWTDPEARFKDLAAKLVAER